MEIHTHMKRLRDTIWKMNIYRFVKLNKNTQDEKKDTMYSGLTRSSKIRGRKMINTNLKV